MTVPLNVFDPYRTYSQCDESHADRFNDVLRMATQNSQKYSTWPEELTPEAIRREEKSYWFWQKGGPNIDHYETRRILVMRESGPEYENIRVFVPRSSYRKFIDAKFDAIEYAARIRSDPAPCEKRSNVKLRIIGALALSILLYSLYSAHQSKEGEGYFG